jgi:hypothetical protein
MTYESKHYPVPEPTDYTFDQIYDMVEHADSLEKEVTYLKKV